MTRISYAQEQLRITIEYLATGQGDVRNRLLGAFSQCHVLREEDFPAEFQQDWKWIMDQVTKCGPLYVEYPPSAKIPNKLIYGSIEDTWRQIKNKTGQKIAEKLFKMSWALLTNDKYK